MNEKECYAFKHSDDTIRRRSTSGGAFTALAEEIINNGGVVFGAALMSDMSVRHIKIDSIEHISLLQGSKYLQSVMGDTFLEVNEELSAGKQVLFSGTPCQVAGLKKYLGRYSENLYTCDIICHGVSSPLIWKDYVKYKEKQYDGKVIKACFRDKFGYNWSDCKETITIRNNGVNIVKNYPSDEYAKIFYDHEAMRPSCYSCKFTNLRRPGDVTLGDFWGIDKAHPSVYDELGVSFVMKNTNQGNRLLKILVGKGCVTRAKLSETKQPQFYKPVRCPRTRKWFWEAYSIRGMAYILTKNENKYSWINVRRQTIHFAKKWIKNAISVFRG